MSDQNPQGLVEAEVWMRIIDSDNLHLVGTITYTDIEIANGVLSTESFTNSVADFVDEVNEILRSRSR